MPTTRNNPGAFTERPPKRLLGYAKTMMRLVGEGELRMAAHYGIAEAANMYNRSRVSPKKERFYCTCCGAKTWAFDHISNRLRIKWDSACPHCDSRSRHRGLFLLYKAYLSEKAPLRILHVAPEPIFYPLFEQAAPLAYVTTDYVLTDVDLPGEDIQALRIDDAQFDLLLCNHVIEHVPDDAKALAEIYRVLRPAGCAILTLPGDWERPHTLVFEDLSFNGHYRDYGWDVVDTLKEIFDDVVCKDLAAYADRYAPLSLGIHSGKDIAFLCFKR